MQLCFDVESESFRVDLKREELRTQHTGYVTVPSKWLDLADGKGRPYKRLALQISFSSKDRNTLEHIVNKLSNLNGHRFLER